MKFRQKMLLAMVWLLSLGYAVGGGILIRQSFLSGLSQAKNSAADSYEMLLQTVQLVNLVDVQQDLYSVRAALERVETGAGQVGLSLRQNGTELFSSGESARLLVLDGEFRALSFTREGRKLYQISGSVPTNADPLRLDAIYDLSPVYDARSAQLASYHRSFALLLLAGGFTAWLASWLLTRPLYRVSGTARQLSAGKLEARVHSQGRDEISQLGRDFDQMADKLSGTIIELQQNMEQQERFMGSFAHELKTPMTSVIGYADLLRSQSLDEAEAQEAANYIFSEARRLESLSWKLLDLLMMRHNTLHLVPTQIDQLIESLVSHLQPVYAGQGIVLQCRCEPGVCSAEPDLMRSVLTNLTDNARKALDQGGNIYILGARSQEGYQIRVLDNGRGMPEEALSHLTEAFYRVDKARSRAQGGVGLGLALCRQIIELHGGSIAFASREGNGTCVTVTLKEALV